MAKYSFQRMKAFGASIVCAALTATTATYALSDDSKLCDLGALLQDPERLTDATTCTGFFVKVDDQPVTCGLYDKLIPEMKSAWARAAESTCGASDTCKELMAECASRSLSGADLSAARSESASAATSESSTSAASSFSHSASAEVESSSSSSSSYVLSSSSASQSTSSSHSSAAPARVPPSQVTVIRNSSASSSSAQSGTSSSASSSAGVSHDKGSSRVKAVFTNSPNKTKTPVAPTPHSHSSKKANDCYVCIYDVRDPTTKVECEVRIKEAKKRGVKNPVIAPNNLSLANFSEQLCSCDNITVLADVHGSPGDEWLPFQEITEILEVAPQCSNVTFDNWRCSGFDSATAALNEAEKLSRYMAHNGYAGTVTVKGRQTIHQVQVALKDVLAQVDAGLMNGVDGRPIDTPMKRFSSKMILKKLYPYFTRDTKYICDLVNTPITFQVCAEDVRLVLEPCKKAGDISLIDKGMGGTQTIVCAKDGKRANQDCEYIGLNDVPETRLPSGITLRQHAAREFQADGCQPPLPDGRPSGVCLCKWKEAEVCS